MPTVEDALRLVTSRDHRASPPPSAPGSSDSVEMSAERIVADLQAMGATQGGARALVAEAASRVGGRTWLDHHSGTGPRVAGPKIGATLRVMVPASALRDPE